MSQSQAVVASRGNLIVVGIALVAGALVGLTQGGAIGFGALLGVMLIGGFLSSRIAQVC